MWDGLNCLKFGPIVNSCEDSNEPPVSIKYCEFLDQLCVLSVSQEGPCSTSHIEVAYPVTQYRPLRERSVD